MTNCASHNPLTDFNFHGAGIYACKRCGQTAQTCTRCHTVKTDAIDCDGCNYTLCDECEPTYDCTGKRCERLCRISGYAFPYTLPPDKEDALDD